MLKSIYERSYYMLYIILIVIVLIIIVSAVLIKIHPSILERNSKAIAKGVKEGLKEDEDK